MIQVHSLNRFWLVVVVALMTACSREPAGAKAQPTYDPQTGWLRTLRFDANKNGTLDSTSYMNGTRIFRVEADLDENGKVERWEFYREDRSLEKVGFASRNDGVMDSQAFYRDTRPGQPVDPATLERIEISTRRDGRFDRTEYYESGVLVRSEEDANGDGRADKWDTYGPIPGVDPNLRRRAITTTAFDDSGRGWPDRRFTWGPAGAVAKVEYDPDGDGVFESPQAITRKQ